MTKKAVEKRDTADAHEATVLDAQIALANALTRHPGMEGDLRPVIDYVGTPPGWTPGDGLIDTSTPPPEPPTPPTLVSFAPSQGLPGTVLTVAGAGFGAQGPSSQVTVGDVAQTITQWLDDLVWVEATQGANEADTPYPVVLHTDAGATLACGDFTFNAPTRRSKS